MAEIPQEIPDDDGEDALEFRDLVTLRQYRDLSEAIIARGAIESAGIFCFLKDENLVRLDWQLSNMIGGIRLQVGSADVQAAEAVLAQPIPEAIDFDSSDPDFQQPVVLVATPPTFRTSAIVAKELSRFCSSLRYLSRAVILRGPVIIAICIGWTMIL